MYVDESINIEDEIIKKIKVSKEYEPKSNNIDLLIKRYKIWKELYTSNKKNILTI